MSLLFSEEMFSKVEPILDKIYNHQFVKELCDGTLAKEKFVYYMQQDSLYLVDYTKALALVAAKSYSEQDISLNLDFAQGALLAERSLHEEYFTEFSVVTVLEKMPACFAYTSYLLNIAALDSVHESMAALLPCFWIYNEVGKHILKQAKPNNPYQKWINTYSGGEFEKVTLQAIDYTDKLAKETTGLLNERMKNAFIKSCKMEYYFWNDAYNLTSWAV
ncbi:thiaminase II [Desulfovibrio litoralis]|uniref:Aminopyrimidine aminohydrolase n=1 Tax=Desulfovibrio litoralis DSM 11393 TaxID=1121455 RepID=A0A1M7SL72_9BACT|nr:thiaminase II [Desulfovibrio litoralis]SHN59205.1 thiaminase /4-amino-5-aminomethyl-2-methylpyrimidine deaminase [Desulfovibrio litoralis DSM 11393]